MHKEIIHDVDAGGLTEQEKMMFYLKEFNKMYELFQDIWVKYRIKKVDNPIEQWAGIVDYIDSTANYLKYNKMQNKGYDRLRNNKILGSLKNVKLKLEGNMSDNRLDLKILLKQIKALIKLYNILKGADLVE